MDLKLSDKWKKTTAFNTFEQKIVHTGYEYTFSNVTRGGGIRLYSTLTEDNSWLFFSVHRVFRDCHEERLCSLNMRVTSQEDFEKVFSTLCKRYEVPYEVNEV